MEDMIWGCGFIDCKDLWRLYILVCCVLKRVDWFIDIKNGYNGSCLLIVDGRFEKKKISFNELV